MKVKWLLKQIGTTLWEHRSDIEYVAGNAAIVAGTAMVISKAEDAIEVKHEYERQKRNIELTDEADGWESKRERGKAAFKMYKDAGVGYAKVYGPGLLVETGGLVLVGVSKATDKKEIASKSIALASLATQFYNYRQAVIEDQGEDKDEKYLMDSNTVEVVEVKEDGTTTSEKLVTKAPSHSFLFDEHNPNWEKETFMNLDFLESRQFGINDKLWVEGILWENDIRRYFGEGVDEEAGAGDWGITAVDDEGNRQYISIGLDKDTERVRAFKDGTERSFWCHLDNMEPNISRKIYRLNKYHKDYSLQGSK